jgi:hypothetical protein
VYRVFVISRGGDIPWPARCPDLTVCDYFLWVYPKSKAFLMKQCDNDELKNAINQSCASSGDSELRRVSSGWITSPFLSEFGGS